MRRRVGLTIIVLLALLLTGCSAAEGSSFIMYGDSDGEATPIQIDEPSGSLTTISYAHHMIHSGNSYTAVGNDYDLDIGDNFTLTLITPDTATRVHVVWQAEGTNAIHIFLFEDAIVSSPGVAITPVNRNRNSLNTTTVTARENDTISDFGTQLWEWHTGDRKIAGEEREVNEYILKQNTTYLLVISSEADNNMVSGQANWYEVN